MARTIIEVCACTRCSMMGSMEIADNVLALQLLLDENDEPKYDIELKYISRPDLTEEDPALAPIVFVNGLLYTNADASIIMDAIVRDSEKSLSENN